MCLSCDFNMLPDISFLAMSIFLVKIKERIDEEDIVYFCLQYMSVRMML